MINVLIRRNNYIIIFSIFILSLFFINCKTNSQSTSIINKDTIDKMIHTGRYKTCNVDINSDGKLDLILYNKPFFSFNDDEAGLMFYGDTMYFFKRINDTAFLKVFEGWNFCEDGGFQITGIFPTENADENFYIETRFPKGEFKALHYIKYQKPNDWILARTQYIVNYHVNEKIERNCICNLPQNININDFRNETLSKPFNYLPTDIDKDSFCECSNK